MKTYVPFALFAVFAMTAAELQTPCEDGNATCTLEQTPTAAVLQRDASAATMEAERLEDDANADVLGNGQKWGRRRRRWICHWRPYFIPQPLVGEYIVFACPEGSRAVTSTRECHKAARSLGMSYTGVTSSHNQAGCIAVQDGSGKFGRGGTALFNTKGNDAASNQRPICKRCEVYQYGMGNPLCGRHSWPVIDEVMCQEAAVRLGGIFRQRKQIPVYPTGCIDVKGSYDTFINEKASGSHYQGIYNTDHEMKTDWKQVCQIGHRLSVHSV